MKEKVQYYRNSIAEADGIACVMMVLHYLGILASERLTQETEQTLYRRYRADSYPTVLPSALAEALSSYDDLDVALTMHSGTLQNNGFCYPRDIFPKLLYEDERRYCRLKRNFRFYRNDIQLIEDQIEAGYVVITAIPGCGKNAVKWITVYGLWENGFCISDPQRGNIQMTFMDLQCASKTSIGTIRISVRKKDCILSEKEKNLEIWKKKIRTDFLSGDGRFSAAYLYTAYPIGYKDAHTITADLTAEGCAEYGIFGERSVTDEYGIIKQIICNRRMRSPADADTGTDDEFRDLIIEPNQELLLLISNNCCDRGRLTALIRAENNINAAFVIPYTDEENVFLTTYLRYALSYCNETAIKLLLDYGADPNGFDCRFGTFDCIMADLVFYLFSTSAQVKARLCCARELLEHGMNTDVVFGDSSDSSVQEMIDDIVDHGSECKFIEMFFAALQQMIPLYKNNGTLDDAMFYDIWDNVTGILKDET